MLTVILLTTFSSVVTGTPQSNGIIPNFDERIVGGTPTTIANHSYQISLLRRNRHYCGGGIISSTWVVTAAHCVFGGLNSAFSIRAGSSSSTTGGQIIAVSRILYHSNYNRGALDYDIALIQLVSPLTITNANPIPIVPAGTGPATGAIATITGWGVISEGGIPSPTLQVVQVPIISQGNCRAAYNNIAVVTDRMFCAGVLGIGGKDSCQGDSGGPVVIGGALAGIISWGVGCGRPRYPGVYVNLYAFRTWIDFTLSMYRT